MKIAWIGPMINDGGGATGVASQLLRGLAHEGVKIDCYLPGQPSSVPESLSAETNLNFYCLPSPWQWNRWYSKNNFLAFITGQIANLRVENQLARQLTKRHQEAPYDVVYQFSHIELSSLKRYRHRLPPIILHPSVHAAGELRWHRKESNISKKTERFIIRTSVRMLLILRTVVQKRHIRLPKHILSLSQNFSFELINDYHVPPDKLSIMPNPIDVKRFTPATVKERSDKIRILFVSRIAVRKGVQMVVELSHRLNDLADLIEIKIVGYKSLWSDYMPLLQNLNPKVATWIGEIRGDGSEMAQLYQSSDMLIQPSQYEPFGLTVGEALACGTPVVSSDKVGASENVDPLCCRIFPHSNMNSFEQEVRTLIAEVGNPELAERIRMKARGEAERLFSIDAIMPGFIYALSSVTESSAKCRVGNTNVGRGMLL